MATTDWFTHDRFGMFVHFGLYSGPGGVWKGRKNKHNYSEWLQASEHVPRPEYRALTTQFNPISFNADEWIGEARNAGMKYFLITAKHHDGFALWPTKASSYNVMDETPFKRDILGELAGACKRHGVRLGFYYSHWQDWEGTGGDICAVHMENEEYVHPTREQFEHYWQNKCLVQVRELIENYAPWGFWFDTWGDYAGKGDFTAQYITPERQQELIGLVHGLSPDCLVNSRIRFTEPPDNVDYLSMMDNHFPDQGFDKPWETPGTLNHSWAYHSLDYQWKSIRQLIQNLVGNASLGGNYQLNIGPMGDGCFEPAAIRRLREIGAWLHVNGEAVYGSSASPVGTPDWGRVTCRSLDGGGTRLYLHLWDCAPGEQLAVTAPPLTVTGAQVIETRQPVQTATLDTGLQLAIPVELKHIELPVVALDVVESMVELSTNPRAGK